VLSARHRTVNVATVVPAFESLRRVQDKISAFRTLQAIGIPQPESVVAKSADNLIGLGRFPVFVKRAISTASAGVRRAASPAELEVAAAALGLGASEVLVQAQVSGPLAMVQALADNGRLIAHHANLRVREGVGGGASIKESIALPMMSEHLEKLVASLHWHGPLSMDVIVTRRGPIAIDVNPRLVEPMNAYLSGVDLVGAMLDLARHAHPPAQAPSKAGVRSRQLLLAILGAAQQTRSRTAVARELVRALRKRGEYAGAVEELTPIFGDPIGAIPVIAAAVSTLAWPPLWQSFHSGAVGSYALAPETWREIVSASERDPVR